VKILILTQTLAVGGAQRQLTLLAKGLRARGDDVAIASFYRSASPFAEQLAAAGVRLIWLGKRGRWDIAGFVLRLLGVFRRERPRIVHGFLPVANIAAVLAKVVAPGTRVVFGVRASNMDLARYDWLAGLSYRIEGLLARFADLAIANAEAGRAAAVARGFPEGLIEVIANGIDCDRFRPDREARARLRAELGLAADDIVIGMVARTDPMKGHPVFLEAAAVMLAKRRDLRFLCVGDGPPAQCRRLVEQAEALGVGKQLIWLSQRADAESVLNALDLLVLPSLFGEGFSNVLAEAMACDRPCVATDVGEARAIVGDTGVIVAPGDAGALAAACLALLARTAAMPATGGAGPRARILALYSSDRMVERTAAALRAIVK